MQHKDGTINNNKWFLFFKSCQKTIIIFHDYFRHDASDAHTEVTHFTVCLLEHLKLWALFGSPFEVINQI